MSLGRSCISILPYRLVSRSSLRSFSDVCIVLREFCSVVIDACMDVMLEACDVVSVCKADISVSLDVIALVFAVVSVCSVLILVPCVVVSA